QTGLTGGQADPPLLPRFYVPLDPSAGTFAPSRARIALSASITLLLSVGVCLRYSRPPRAWIQSLGSETEASPAAPISTRNIPALARGFLPKDFSRHRRFESTPLRQTVTAKPVISGWVNRY